MKTGAARLWAYARPYGWILAASLCLVAIVGFLEAVTTVLPGIIYDTFLRDSPATSVSIPFVKTKFDLPSIDPRLFLLMFVAATVIKTVAEYGSISAIAYMGNSVVRDLRNDVFEKIVFQPLRFFHFNPTGELISRVSADIDRVQTAASETLAEFLKQTATLISLIVVIFGVDWKLASVSLALVPLVFYPTLLFGKKLRLLSKSNQEEMAAMANLLYETVTGNRIVKAFTMERAEAGKFRKLTQRILKLNVRQKMTHSLASPMMEVLGVFVIAGFFLYARTQIISQRMTPGLFLIFILSLIKLYDPVRRMSGINNSFQQAFGASGRVFEILGLDTEKDTGNKMLTTLSDRIEFENVSFAYEPGVPVFDGLSFAVGRGEVIAIVGPSGAGKSTLVNLVPRFYDVTSGRMLIDGIDVRDLRLESLRRQVAMVTQDVILFDDSIRANIAYGDPAAGEDAIRRAAKAALVDEFVSDYDSRIGERGLRLSGGERQRISIARAILKNAPILILDEATSSLDAESEALVQRALQNLMEGRTTIVIAHRLSTVRRADRIIVLADGRIKESGTHEELVVRRGLYWKLYNLQFEDVSS
ncbi:MAG TPA: ABC transporter transmembrane domain-containing protein [Terriglobia bacterium]|jgi:subfamily B ATP-binding cassette protein MsbA